VDSQVSSIENVLPLHRITDRSTIFCSSRIFPGHEYFSQTSNVLLSIRRIRLAIFSANRLRKYSIRTGISSRRLRSGVHGRPSQVPWGLEALSGIISKPAWRTKPSWYLVTTEDRMIPPDAQRGMSKRAGSNVVEVKASHVVYVSQPQAVATIIAKAAKGAASAATA